MKRCKHRNCIILEEFTVHNEFAIHDGKMIYKAMAMEMPTPTGKLFVRCLDCGMERNFYPMWPKWLEAYLEMDEDEENQQ
jgi:hypothetical protein